MVSLIDDITLPGVEVIVKPVQDYRFVLIFRGVGLSSALNETDPQKVGLKPLKIRPLDGSPQARKTADLANEWVKRASRVKKPTSSKYGHTACGPASQGSQSLKMLSDEGGCHSRIPDVQRACESRWHDA